MASSRSASPPTGLIKRKRQDEDEGENRPAKRSPSPGSPDRQQRTIGPAIGPTLPPANLDEIPLEGPDGDDQDGSSDDDDYGPALPSAASGKTTQHTNSSSSTFTNIGSQAPAKGQRDEWMLVPPSSDDWSSRVDPTKLKNRKFNTGKGAKAPPAEKGDKAIWTETADEKRARLEREVMGIQEPGRPIDRVSRDPKAEATAAKIREHTEKARGATLYDEHKKSTTKEADDDPSARAFDREKDIGGGKQINHTQRREMLKRAGDFGSRFQSAKYL